MSASQPALELSGVGYSYRRNAAAVARALVTRASLL
jgi:hypothetical protein